MAHISKTFRIFVSSTFGDLKAERNALQEHVFPKLRELCTKHGCRFQAIDLRWGVSDEAGLDQRTMQICLKEIARCQNVTPRPNFIVLLGDRYGWCPLPSEIDADEFEEILREVPKQALDFLLWDDEQPQYERGWYRKDENAVPPVYCLRPREVNIPEGASDKERDEAFEKERNEWTIIERRLRTAFLEAINKLGWSNNDPRRFKYEASATHQEIVDGAMKTEDADEHVFGYFRSMKNLDELNKNLPGKPANNFVDTDDKGLFDNSSHQKLLDMKTDLKGKLRDNIHEYDARWIGSNENPISYDHIQSICDEVYKDLSGIILTEIAKFKAVDELEAEIEQHLNFGEERRQFFVGRKEILKRIEKHLESDNKHPLAIHGVSGSGKSALMAEAFMRTEKKHPKAIKMTRFTGVTPASSEIRSLLEELCKQIYRDFNFKEQKQQKLAEIKGYDEKSQEEKRRIEEEYSIPSEIQKISKAFKNFLSIIPKNRKLILFLDALDQLSTENNARMLYWLPKELPVNVQIIVSTLPGECLNALEKKLPKDNIIELEPMEPDEGGDLLNKWLDDAKRKLQKTQRGEVLNKFEQCKLPLYLKLAFEEARLWRSFDEVPDLGCDTPEIIKNLFDRLSDPANHGENLVSHALSYLRCARHGLTEDEMLDLLARDKEYFDDFLEHIRHELPKTNGERRLPVVIWSRLYHDLERYLTWRAGDNTSLLAFFHRQFGEVVDEKYLDEEKKTSLHKKIADYFFNQGHEFVDEKGKKIPNHRKMSELPYQQSYGKDWKNLETTLTDLTFIETKCTAGKTYDLVSDYNRLGVGRAQPGPITKTAWKHEGRLGVWCPQCLAWFQIDESQLGKVINCPECKSKLKINPFIIEAKWHPQGAQREVPKREKIEDASLSSDVGEFTDFVRNQSNIVREYPQLTFQQAANQPDKLAPAKIAHRLWKSGIEKRSWIRWINKPQYKNPCIATLSGHSAWVHACSYSPDGHRIVSASSDKTLKVWDTESSEAIATLSGHAWDVSACSYSPDGRRIVSGSYFSLKVWDAESSEEIATLSRHSHRVWACSYSPDGHRIVSGSWDKTLKIWDAESGKEIATLSGHSREVDACSYSPDGRHIVSGSRDKTLKIWDAESGEEIATLSGHSSYVEACSYSPDGRRIVSGSRDKTLKIWDAESGEEIATLSGHSNDVFACSYSPDGHCIVSGSYDNTLKIWDAESGEEIATLSGHSDTVRCCAYSPDGRRIVSGSNDNTLKFWDAESGEKIATLSGHSSEVKACSYSPDGRRIVSAGGWWQKTLKVWDAESGEVIATLSGHSDYVSACSYSPDGSRIVTGSIVHKTLKVWNAESGEEIATLSGHSNEVWACSYSPDGSRIVSGSWDKTLKIWDAESGEERVTLSGHSGRVWACSYSPDGRRIVSGSHDKTLKIWDAESGKEIATLSGHLVWVRACSYSPDGSRIISGSHDATLKVWDAESGEEVSTLLGHSDEVSACSYSPDGRCIVSGSRDKTLKVWDAESGKLILFFPANYIILSMDLETSKGHIAAGDADGNLYILQIENLPIGPPILTPWRSPNGDSYAFGCAFCRKWSPIKQSDLGTELDCPKCGNKVKLNPFTINADWRPIAKAWGDENYK